MISCVRKQIIEQVCTWNQWPYANGVWNWCVQRGIQGFGGAGRVNRAIDKSAGDVKEQKWMGQHLTLKVPRYWKSLFYVSPVLALGYCHCLHLFDCMCVLKCVNHEFVRAVIHHWFRLKPSNWNKDANTLVKSLLFWRLGGGGGGALTPMYSQFVAVYCYRQLRVFWHLMFLLYKNVIRFNHVVPMNWVIICSGIGMSPGPRLNIKTVLSRYGDFHVKDKTAVRTSYL